MPINNVNQEQEFGYISSEFFTIYYRNDDGDWINIPGAQDISFSGTSSPTRDVVPANGAVSKRVGRVRVPEVSLNCYYIPNDLAWRYLRQAQRDRTSVRFRVDWDADLIFASQDSTLGGTFAVSITGSGPATAAFAAGSGSGADAALTVSNDAIGRGQMIMTLPPKNQPDDANFPDSRFFIVSAVSNAATPVINVVEMTATETNDNEATNFKKPASAQSAVRFKLFNPAPHRVEFNAAVVQGSDMDMGAESEMMTNLILAPRRSLEDPQIIRVARTYGDE